ncbi:MAG TPA: UvrD-helicase domain-containing protein [Planctomycetota bacterium]|nr:UvrD-helicase domain-containing protein [Planctomycetota bacterium]
MPIDVFKDMNPEQREAIAHLEGPLLVIAGAGSGKTRVITHRIANIIQHGTRPDRILAITFTNKAAGEMKERIERLLGLKTPWITTFHSAGLRMLKLEQARLGFQHPFTVMDEDDQKKFFKRIMAELQIDPKLMDPRQVQWQISKWKNAMAKPEEVYPASELDDVAKRAWAIYGRMQQEECVLDFDDLLVWPVRLMEGDAELRKKWQERFPYVLIDEYQDTNAVQYRLVQLFGQHGNVCATGDPDQAIYGWRGADINNILRFEQDFPGCRVVLLEQNYRSSKTILRAAQAVVEHNSQRKDKTIRTDNPEGKKMSLLVVDDEVDESMAVAAACERFKRQDRKLSDMAVFYRTNAQSRALEDGMRRRGLPYRIVGGTRFYDRREVKDLMAYLKLLVNPRDLTALDRIANIPKRGVGEKTLAALLDIAQDEGVGFHEILMTDQLIERVAVGRNAKPLNELMRTWRTLRGLPVKNPAACAEGIIELTGLEEHYLAEDDGDGGFERVANIKEVITAAEQYHEVNPDGGLEGFLDQVALVTSTDAREQDRDVDQVTLMTLHAAKGLEFPIVFITGCEQGVMPLQRQGQVADIEEERRLMYVGITRAKEELYISRAVCRMQYGQTNRNEPSVFLSEIPPDCFVEKDASSRARVAGGGDDQPRRAREDAGPRRSAAAALAGLPLMTGADLRQQIADRKRGEDYAAAHALETTAAEGDPFAAGDRVVHTVLGRGRVVGLAGRPDDRRVVIDFDQGGQKELLLAFCTGKLSRE